MMMRKPAWTIVIMILLFSACVSFGPHYYKLGNQAEINKNWDEAIKYYEQAIRENPKEYTYKMSLTRVKLAASLSHIKSAQELAAEGKKEEALKEYEKALSYDPQNRAIVEAMRHLTEPPSAEEEVKPLKLENPVKLDVPREKIELKFTEASLRSIFLALGKHAGVNIIFDEQFRDAPLTIDIAGRDFEDAVSFLCLASKNFYRVIDEKTLIVVPDQPVKRIQYEQNAIQVFYLSNINAQDIFAALQQMLRTQYRAPNIFVDKNLNTITVRDTPGNIELAAELLKKWDKSKAEVVIDLEIMEVSRQKLREIGVDLDTATVGLRYAGPGASEDAGWFNLGQLSFKSANNFEISLPGALIRFLESDADTKVLAQPRLRGIQDEEITTLVGQKIPIPQTTFNPIAAGGVSQQPITSFTYQDVGLDIKLKPKIHLEKEITLEIEIEITNIAGSGYADIPIISTRKVKNMIRLKDGEINLLAGLLRDEERRSMRGVIGLKSIPILGNLFSATDQTIDQSDLVMTITPYIIRPLARTKEDEKPLWIELEGISTSGRLERGLGEEPIGSERPGIPMDLMDQAREREAPQETGENRISLDPANFEVPQGREFRISVNMRNQQEVGSLSLNLTFNPQVVKLKDIVEGSIVGQLGERAPFLENIAAGGCTIGISSPQVSRGFKGGGNLAVLIFEAAAQGETAIAVAGVSANAPTGQAVSFVSRDARVVVR